jgi:hypothetical protein
VHTKNEEEKGATIPAKLFLLQVWVMTVLTAAILDDQFDGWVLSGMQHGRA